jgi:carbonic anhydrase
MSTEPSTWAKTYPIAVTGTRQSPIDIQTHSCPSTEGKAQLYFDYPETLSDLQLKNTGYGWTVQVPKELSKSVSLEGGQLKSKYSLEQFHAHWGSDCSCGSEHTVDGKSYAAEVRK